ncbi:MAG: baseplate J/gp47 family protein [Anaerolineales bacterium]|nr:baseplate J/gp47 family protein [Anaerolineales bacterium]
MTEIYQIPPEAGLEAVRRSLGRWRGKRVALVAPDSWIELGSVANMRLLQRQALFQQVNLGLVTRDHATRAARAVGIPVFARVEDAAGDRWSMETVLPPIDLRHPEKDLPDPPPWRRTDVVQRITRPTLYQARQKRIEKEQKYRQPLPVWLRWMGTVFLGGLIVLALAAFSFYVLPAATITVVPGRLPLQTNVNVNAVVGLTEPDAQAKQLPARTIKVDLVEKGAAATSGSSQKATDKAVGEVVFSNLGSAPVTIPVGTSVSTSSGTPVEFRTTRDALLESGVGTRTTVPVEALEPGTIGNARANTINTVNGALRFRVRVNNTSPTFGGGSALVPVVTQQDKDALGAQLQAQAEQKAYEALKSQLEPGEWLPPESVQTFVIAQSFDQYNDEEASELMGTVRVLAQGLAVNEREAGDIILQSLQEQMPENARLVADSVSVQREPGSDFQASSVSFTMTVRADYTTPIDADEVRDTVAGRTPEDASTLIKDRWLLKGDPEIYLDPAWKGALPNIGGRIQVRVDYEQEQRDASQ